ncbi:hypothetical protein VTL71DRAFT_2029 [Oculimacula yallundae]|uniref:BZIP domain-containing protein n=1 Tax=Oculimacula yallundae TaxID=86028 RepID=A0ABR4CCG0_9HELO
MDNHDQHPDYYQSQAQAQAQAQAQGQSYYGSTTPTTHHPGFVPIYTQHHPSGLYTPYPQTSQASSSSSPTYPTSDTGELDPEADLKRLRNTAASARFRAKKKQREQTLENQAREKKMALEKLESRIRELETENRFLKGLIMGPKDVELRELKKQRDEVIEADRKGIEHKDGVGTD